MDRPAFLLQSAIYRYLVEPSHDPMLVV